MTLKEATLLSAAQFAALPKSDSLGRCELIEGRIVPLSNPKPKHGRIAQRIARYVDQHVGKMSLGIVYAAETGFLIAKNPDTVRSPDVSFVRTERVAAHDEDEYYDRAPDLAVEVLSPSDRPREMLAKVSAWLAAGAASVWVVDPETESVVIHHDGGVKTSIGADDTLSDEVVLPGFRLTPMRTNL